MRNARLVRANQFAISRRNRPSLSLFRQLTHSRKIRNFITKRVSQHQVFRGFLQPVSPLRILKTLNPVCQARKLRRKVLFSLRLTGKGARSPKKHTFLSKVRCS